MKRGTLREIRAQVQQSDGGNGTCECVGEGVQVPPCQLQRQSAPRLQLGRGHPLLCMCGTDDLRACPDKTLELTFHKHNHARWAVLDVKVPVSIGLRPITRAQHLATGRHACYEEDTMQATALRRQLLIA